jgi:uncharacterized protein YegP (UPF0339 family)
MVTSKKFVAKLHKRVTKVRKTESFWVTIEAMNGEPLFTSEKYVNRADAVHALQLVVPGVPDNMPVNEE